MKYLIGFLVAIIVAIILMVIVRALNFKQENWLFFIGWISGTFYSMGVEIYGDYKNRHDKQL